MKEIKLKAISHGATLGEDVYRKILNGISDFSLAPGLRITQDQLAEILDVSRQPIGPALLLLESQGFVQPTGRRGRIVAQINEEAIQGAAQVLASVDSYVVALAARQVVNEDVSDVRVSILQNDAGFNEAKAVEIYKLISEFFLSFYAEGTSEAMTSIAMPMWTGYLRFLMLAEQNECQHIFSRMRSDIEEIHESVLIGDSNLSSMQTRRFHENTATEICHCLFK